jgi:hypothetical protein
MRCLSGALRCGYTRAAYRHVVWVVRNQLHVVADWMGSRCATHARQRLDRRCLGFQRKGFVTGCVGWYRDRVTRRAGVDLSRHSVHGKSYHLPAPTSMRQPVLAAHENPRNNRVRRGRRRDECCRASTTDGTTQSTGSCHSPNASPSSACSRRHERTSHPRAARHP